LKAAILVGGLGTRLRPVVSDRPKPLAEVAGKPFLLYLLEQLLGQGVREVVLCAGYRWREIEAQLGDGASLGMCIEYSVEDKPLGTGGALRNAQRFLSSTFLALNGDSHVKYDLASLTRFHFEQRSQATLGLAKAADVRAYGHVQVDAQLRIRAFEEKVEAGIGGGLVNAGVYVLEPAVLRLIPEGRQVSLERETFPALVHNGAPMFGYTLGSSLLDIGTPEGYARSQGEMGRLDG
jgi:NDP-sugar pyrophosphorylase family protein